MLCRIGDFDFDIFCRGSYASEKIKPYSVAEGTPVISIEITESAIASEDKLSQIEQGIKFGKGSLEFTAIHRRIADWLPLNNAFVMHSAVIAVENSGIAFAAHSGTGKTTHALLWKQLLGDKMHIVNGDKPIIRFFDEEPNTPYAYGTPWNGKERLGENSRIPLRHICLIERSADNSVLSLSRSDAVDLMFNQTYMPRDSSAAAATMSLMNRLLNCCKLWRIRCNTEIAAAEAAYKNIFSEVNNEAKV